ncbi:hypothetical protein C8R43DRAFT_1135955 [Mycena crocata]|nr:hypothetical protein C8R43DRAFT_1135955 [Mycena crocata]
MNPPLAASIGTRPQSVPRRVLDPSCSEGTQRAFKVLPPHHLSRCLHLSSVPRRLQLDLVQTLLAGVTLCSSSSSRHRSNSESEVFLRCCRGPGMEPKQDRVRVQIKTRQDETELIHIHLNSSFQSERPPPTERIGACADRADRRVRAANPNPNRGRRTFEEKEQVQYTEYTVYTQVSGGSSCNAV